MAEVELKSGRRLVIDMDAITISEYRALFKPITGDADQQRENEILGRAAGLTAEEVGNLPQREWRRVVKAILQAAQEPLADPNSESASTST
jgi:hypothetical protein